MIGVYLLSGLAMLLALGIASAAFLFSGSDYDKGHDRTSSMWFTIAVAVPILAFVTLALILVGPL